jgi:hypothetical protein
MIALFFLDLPVQYRWAGVGGGIDQLLKIFVYYNYNTTQSQYFQTFGKLVVKLVSVQM